MNSLYSGNVCMNYLLLFFLFILQIDKPNESPVVLKGHNAEVTDVSWNNNDFTKVGIIALLGIKKNITLYIIYYLTIYFESPLNETSNCLYLLFCTLIIVFGWGGYGV